MAEAGGNGGGWSDARSAAGNRSPWLIAGVVSLATFMEVLDISIANVSLDHIAGELSASYDETTWVLTSYLIANAIAVPISGWLSKVVGRKRFYMACVALFTISSLFCGLAPSLPLLIIARVFQGIGGGGLAPSEQSILTETFPPAKRGGAFAIYGLTVITAPILGPTLGGLITDQTSWHWIFFLNVPIGLLSLFLVHTFVVDPPLLEEERKKRLSGGLKVDVSASFSSWRGWAARNTPWTGAKGSTGCRAARSASPRSSPPSPPSAVRVGVAQQGPGVRRAPAVSTLLLPVDPRHAHHRGGAVEHHPNDPAIPAAGPRLHRHGRGARHDLRRSGHDRDDADRRLRGQPGAAQIPDDGRARLRGRRPCSCSPGWTPR